MRYLRQQQSGLAVVLSPPTPCRGVKHHECMQCRSLTPTKLNLDQQLVFLLSAVGCSIRPKPANTEASRLFLHQILLLFPVT